MNFEFNLLTLSQLVTLASIDLHPNCTLIELRPLLPHPPYTLIFVVAATLTHNFYVVAAATGCRKYTYTCGIRVLGL